MIELRRPPEWGPEPVPNEKKILRFIDVFVLWFSLGIGLLVMQAGVFLVLPTSDYGMGLSFVEAMAITIVGSLIGSFLLGLAGIIGTKYGVPTMVSTRPMLGRIGSYIPTILNIIQLVGWTAFEFWVMSWALTTVSGEFLGAFTRVFWLIVIAIWCYLLVIGGPLVVVREYLEKFAVWIVVILTAIVTIWLFTNPSWLTNIFSYQGDAQKLYLLALDLVIVMPISWMPLISDYNRFAQKAKIGFWGTLISYTIANSWFYLLGAALYLASGTSDVVSALVTVAGGMSWLILIFIVLDETDNAFADIYSTAVSTQNVEKKVPQWLTGLVTTIIGMILALTLDLSQYEIFLLFIGAAFVPLFGVIIADFFVVRKQNYDIKEFYEEAPKIRWESIISWALGVVVYYIIYYIYPWVGSTLPAFLTAFALRIILDKIKR